MEIHKIKEVKLIKEKYYFVDNEGIVVYILKKEKAISDIYPMQKSATAKSSPFLTLFRDEDGVVKKAVFNKHEIYNNN